MSSESQGRCVNRRLQFYGTKNFRVVDASIFPTIPAGNLNAPTVMVAWKASRLIKDYKIKFNKILFFLYYKHKHSKLEDMLISIQMKFLFIIISISLIIFVTDFPKDLNKIFI
jgi:hypothetical protein